MATAQIQQQAAAPPGRRRRNSKRPVWMEAPHWYTQIGKALILVFTVVVMLYPFLYVIFVSLSNPDDFTPGDLLLWPRNFTYETYNLILHGQTVPRALVVSIGVTVVGTLLSMIFTVTLAYGLTRTARVPGSRPMLLLVLFTMLFSAGIIPGYLLVRSLGLLNNYLSLIIPSMISAFNMIVIRNFFMDLPEELFDSARVDGAGELQILMRIVLPLSKAVLAVIALFYGVSYWNSFFQALIFLDNPRMWPIQLILRSYVLQSEPIPGTNIPVEQTQVRLTPETLQMTVVVLATVPILIVYPFLQRYFTKGVLTGAIKG